VIDFLINLFNTEGFTIRSHCGISWNLNLIVLNVSALLIVIVGYYSLVFQMWSLYKQRKDQVPKKNVFLLLVFFFSVCGLAKVSQLLGFWWAPYRFFIITDWFCAISVVVLVLRLRTEIHYLAGLPSYSLQLEINKDLKERLLESKEIQDYLKLNNKSLQNVVDHLQQMTRNQLWYQDHSQAVEQLSKIVAELSTKQKNDGV